MFCLKVIKNCFRDDPLFRKAWKEGFEDSVNKEYYVSALLARYSHRILSKNDTFQGSVLGSPDEIFENIAMLYGYIRDKDIFERDFRTFLSTRLLEGSSEGEKMERCLIAKLQKESGKGHTFFTFSGENGSVSSKRLRLDVEARRYV